MSNPIAQYSSFDQAYDWFNSHLFEGKLPVCMITLQRKKQAKGYFWAKQFGSRIDKDENIDEIALNPDSFVNRSDAEILSTLVHEMVHLWQEHFGKPGKGNYHNREWAAKMKEIGLQPYNVKNPEIETGSGCSHSIIADGRFILSYVDLINECDFKLEWEAKPVIETKQTRAKRKSKTKYTCPFCEINIWGKPELEVYCGCGEMFEEST